MKFQFALIVICSLLIISCTKDEDFGNEFDQPIELRGNDKINLCHYNKGTDTWKVISVKGRAAAAHIRHGDILLIDEDGDGWVVAENECVPGGDCNDNDDTVYPGAEEICGNFIDNNCNFFPDEGCVDCCFNDALLELQFTCWNGDFNNPVLYDLNPQFGMCSSCLGGNCGYFLPDSPIFIGDGSSEECRLYLLQLVEYFDLGVGPFCNPINGESNNVSSANIFGS